MQKTVTILTCLILSLTILLPTSVLAADNGLFTLQNNLELEWDEDNTDTTIDPLSEDPLNIKINTSYSITAGTISKLILIIFNNKQATITFEITDKAEWINASLDPENMTSSISETPQTDKITLKINPDKNINAYEEGQITIKANVGDIKGPLGLLSLLKAVESNEIKINVTQGYYSDIEVNTINLSQNITPYKETEIPINVTNNGNGNIIVKTELSETKEIWNATISNNVTISPGKTKTLKLKFKPDHKFKEENVYVNIYSVEEKDQSNMGKMFNLSYELKNDGSYTEETESENIDTILIIILIAIIILCGIIFYFYRGNLEEE